MAADNNKVRGLGLRSTYLMGTTPTRGKAEAARENREP
jgi:hypothetical protein